MRDTEKPAWWTTRPIAEALNRARDAISRRQRAGQALTRSEELITASRVLLNRNASRDETDLQMVQRHVREGEAHVARQHEIVAKFRDGSELREKAGEFLDELKSTLRDHKAHLARLKKEAGS